MIGMRRHRHLAQDRMVYCVIEREAERLLMRRLLRGAAVFAKAALILRAVGFP